MGAHPVVRLGAHLAIIVDDDLPVTDLSLAGLDMVVTDLVLGEDGGEDSVLILML